MWGARATWRIAGQMRRGWWADLSRLLLLLSMLALGAPRVSAQSEAPPEAIELYRSGRAHYDAGRYREAIVDLKAALALDPESPNLLYNVARVSELLGNLDEAIAYYQRYVGMLSDAENDERDRINATIHRLEGARTELATRAPQQPETLREVVYREPPPAGKADALFWIVGGSGVAMIGGSVATALIAVAREKDANQFVLGESGSAAERDQLVQEANAFALLTDVLWIGGLTAITSATLLYFLRDPEAPPERRVQVGVAGTGDSALLSVGGTF